MSKDQSGTPKDSVSPELAAPKANVPAVPESAARKLLAMRTKTEHEVLLKRIAKRPPKFKQGADGKLEAAGDRYVNHIRILEAFASGDSSLISRLLEQLAGTVPCAETGHLEDVNFAAAVMHSLEPRDGLEALLCVQMAGVHNLAMKFLGRAAHLDQTELGVNLNVDRAARLLRMFIMQVEALKAHRSKGQQRVEVEHVHVHRGAQAIVGAVNHSTTGNGGGDGRQT